MIQAAQIEGLLRRDIGFLLAQGMDSAVINGDGVLVYKGAIDDKPSPDPATIEGATSYVGNALAALKNGKPVEPAETKSYGCPVKY